MMQTFSATRRFLMELRQAGAVLKGVHIWYISINRNMMDVPLATQEKRIFVCISQRQYVYFFSEKEKVTYYHDISSPHKKTFQDDVLFCVYWDNGILHWSGGIQITNIAARPQEPFNQLGFSQLRVPFFPLWKKTFELPFRTCNLCS